MAKRERTAAEKAVANALRAKSRPGRSKLTDVESRERRQALRIYRGLDLTLAKIMKMRAEDTLHAMEKLRSKSAKFEPGEIRQLLEGQMTNMDVKGLHAEIQDRWGTPRRSVSDVALTSAKPVVLVVGGEGLGWPGLTTGATGGVVVDRGARTGEQSA